MQKFKMTRLAAYCTVALGLAACGASGSSSGSSGTGGTGGSGSGSGSADILDATQGQLSGVLTGLGNQLSVVDSNSPLKVGAFVKCLDPAVNQLLDGPDGLLTDVLQTINTGVSGGLNSGATALDPAAIQGGVADLAGGLQSLTVTLPRALLVLAGQGSCSSTSPPGGSNPLAFLTSLANQSNSPLQPLFNALIAAGVPGNGGGTGPTGTPLDVILGPLTQLAGGSGTPGNITDLASVVNVLGTGVQTLGGALTQNLGSQTQAVPVVGGVVNLLGDAITDVGAVLTDLDNGTTTNQQLLGTVNDLLTNLTTTLAVIPGSSTLVTPVQGGINQVTSGLNSITAPLSQLLDTVTSLPGTSGTSGGTLPTGDIPVLGGLLDNLLDPVVSGVTGGSTGGTGGTTSPTDTLNNIPVIGPILGGLLGGLI